MYQQMYHIYTPINQLPIKPDEIITEDSNSGYDFFKSVSEEKGIICKSANGKSNIFKMLKNIGSQRVCVIADGAAIGPEMDRLYKTAQKNKKVNLYLPESFEWIILKSGLIEGKEIQKILEEPEAYVDSKEFFSWERYFTKFLIDKTEDTYLKYKKAKLNPVYLHEKNKRTILKAIKGIDFDRWL